MLKYLRKYRLKIEILIVFLFFSVSSFSSDLILWSEDKNTEIKFSSAINPTTEDKSNNNHPATLNENYILNVLSNIQRIKNKTSSEQLFTHEQQKTLAKYVAIGLNQAGPNQDILFSLDKKERSLGGFRNERYFVTGRVFYDNDLLNIIIGEHDRLANNAYEMAYDPTNQGLVEYDFNYGARNTPKFPFDDQLTFTSQGIKLKSDSRTDWITADLASVHLASGNLVNSNLVSGNLTGDYQASQPNFQASTQPSLQPNLQQTSQASPHTTQNQTTGNSGHQDTTHNAVTFGATSLMQRFKTLEALRKESLITEEEYQQKREALLRSL
ncbi:SHOCT domain-containing protein [Alteromonas sp. 1_MG-2023]|uniref:SHOCT domain-containing protein n=1 Tax=Alteromonas sp. 1_MG-2023 TaxID=3062669 RepID=UPI0026E429E2|nr:SHOCT domain-containing protein [Alteromonas sp. 1_MG-2023]MDO6567333.1 SHOCT domain-containing protein [Alteromonas sp. 1_MG-2023]